MATKKNEKKFVTRAVLKSRQEGRNRMKDIKKSFDLWVKDTVSTMFKQTRFTMLDGTRIRQFRRLAREFVKRGGLRVDWSRCVWFARSVGYSMAVCKDRRGGWVAAETDLAGSWPKAMVEGRFTRFLDAEDAIAAAEAQVRRDLTVNALSTRDDAVGEVGTWWPDEDPVPMGYVCALADLLEMDGWDKEAQKESRDAAWALAYAGPMAGMGDYPVAASILLGVLHQ